MNSPQPPGSLPPIVVSDAIRENCKVKLALSGPSGSGKTYTALSLAVPIAAATGGKVLLVDSERKSALKYGRKVITVPEEGKFAFKHCPVVGDFNPRKIQQYIDYAVTEGYAVLIFDSLTHFWNGTGGFLEQLDSYVKRQQKQDSHAAWKVITPIYRKVVDGIIDAPIHIIVTLRAKQDYSKENGKVTKLGMAPEMRDGFEYEMDLHGLLNVENELHFTKTRCSEVKDRVFPKPGDELAKVLLDWANVTPTAETA